MTSFAGTRTLLRLALRLDRTRLPAWVLLTAALPAATAAQYQKLYPTAASLRQVAPALANSSLIALNGPLFRVSLGGLTAWKILATELVLAGLMSLLTVVRHTRTEEENGRAELVGAGVVGRAAPLTAALLTAGLADLALGALVALGLVGSRLPVAGSVALGLAPALAGAVFAGVAAVAAQLCQSGRTATAVAAGVLGGSYLLRAVGDTGPTWLSWLSPIGALIRLRPYAAERWWAAAPAACLAAVLAGGAYALLGRRDQGAGLLPQRPGPERGAAGLRSPLALAWRLNRGLLLGWTVGLAAWGAALGGVADGISHMVGSNRQISDMLSRLGGGGALVDSYLAAVLGITGLVAAAYTVQATLRLRGEEAGGRVEPVLATSVGRLRWALSHLVCAVLGTGLLLAVAGTGAGLAYGLQVHRVGEQVPRVLAGALVQLPAACVLAGLGVALFGLAPRLTVLTWAGLVVCLVLLEVGALLGLPQWLVDVSPFAHPPRLPGAGFTATPLVWLTAAAAGLTAAGLAGFGRRDID